MRRSLALLLALVCGCASAKIELTFAARDSMPWGIYLTHVTIDPSFYSRGCLDLVVKEDRVALTLQQDGTSDWIAGRAAPAALQGAVMAAMSFVSAPMDVLRQLAGVPIQKPEPPSETHGCEAVLEE